MKTSTRSNALLRGSVSTRNPGGRPRRYPDNAAKCRAYRERCGSARDQRIERLRHALTDACARGWSEGRLTNNLPDAPDAMLEELIRRLERVNVVVHRYRTRAEHLAQRKAARAARRQGNG